MHRRHLACSVTAVLTLGHALPAAAQPVSRLRRPLGIDSTTPGGVGIALTFDDGPHPDGTRAVLAALEARGASATFFMVGEQVRRHPAVAREVVALGHRIGLHGDRHRNLLRVGARATRRDLDAGCARIADATGVVPTVYRPPYGVFTGAALAVARARGWRTLLWTHWGRDWERQATAATVAARVTRRLAPGAVLLLHDADHYSARDSWRATAGALPVVLDRLTELSLPLVAA